MIFFQLALKDNNQQVLTRNDGFRTSHSGKGLWRDSCFSWVF